MFKLENLTQMNAKQKTEYPHKFSSFVHIAVIALALSMAAWGCGGDEGGDGSARSGASSAARRRPSFLTNRPRSS